MEGSLKEEFTPHALEKGTIFTHLTNFQITKNLNGVMILMVRIP